MSSRDIIFFSIWFFLELSSITISLFGNSIVIYSMCSGRILQKKSSYYIISIAVADLVSSLFVFVLTTFRTALFWDSSISISPRLCLWMTSLLLVLTTASILQLVCVSIDRYWAICHPISYHLRETRYAQYVIVVCWLSGIAFGLTPLYANWIGENCTLDIRNLLMLAGLGFFSAVIIIVLYSLIYRRLLKLVRRKYFNNKIYAR